MKHFRGCHCLRSSCGQLVPASISTPSVPLNSKQTKLTIDPGKKAIEL